MYAQLIAEFGKDQVDEIGRMISFESTKRVKDFINTRSGEFITLIDETTRKRIRDAISLASETNASIEELADLIRSEFADFSKARSKLIATTETTLTYGAAAREAMEQAEIYKSVWMTTLDGRERPAHHALSGKISDENGYFYSNGYKTKHPGGFGVGSLDIGCRCAIRAYFEGEKATDMTQSETEALWRRRESVRLSKEKYVIGIMEEYFSIQEEAFFRKFNELFLNI